MPAGPPPATKTFFFSGAGVIANSFSRPVRGLTVQRTGNCEITLVSQPCMQAVHWMMSSKRPSLALFGKFRIGQRGSSHNDRRRPCRSIRPIQR